MATYTLVAAHRGDGAPGEPLDSVVRGIPFGDLGRLDSMKESGDFIEEHSPGCCYPECDECDWGDDCECCCDTRQVRIMPGTVQVPGWVTLTVTLPAP